MRRLFVWCSLFVVVTCGHAIAAEPSIDELIEAGHFKRARAKLKTGTQPANAEEAYQMSRIALAFGDPDGALKHAERAASLEPENARYHVQVAMAAGTSAQRAGVFKQISLAERIKDELEIALGLDKKNVAAYSTLILFYLNAPGIAGGDKGKAKALAEELRSIDPVRGWLAKVQIAREEKKPEVGSPSRAVGRWRLGLVLEKRGRKKEAVAEIEAALKEQPDLKDAKKDLERLRQEG